MTETCTECHLPTPAQMMATPESTVCIPCSRSVYAATRRRDGSVSYWSVYTRVWRTATCQLDVSDRDHAALDSRDRALIAALPADYPDW